MKAQCEWSKRRKINGENEGKWKYYTMVLRKKVEG
jgi:hypothetical protein